MKPIFRKQDDGTLLAFLKFDRMFHLKMNQYGKGDGFEFRVYKTRATVLRYVNIGEDISFQEFQMLLKTAFADYLEEITLLLPKELQNANQDNMRISNNTKRLK